MIWNNLIINWILKVDKLLWEKNQECLQVFLSEQVKNSVSLDMTANPEGWSHLSLNHLLLKLSRMKSEWTTNNISSFLHSSPFIGETVVGITGKTVSEVTVFNCSVSLACCCLSKTASVSWVKSLNTHSSLSSVT